MMRSIAKGEAARNGGGEELATLRCALRSLRGKVEMTLIRGRRILFREGGRNKSAVTPPPCNTWCRSAGCDKAPSSPYEL